MPTHGLSIFDCSADLRGTTDVEGAHRELVPGSPIDCAAMTPTASPIFTDVPRARSRP